MKLNENYIVRLAKVNDANSIYNLSKFAKSGLSNLPKTLKETKELLTYSELSVNNKIHPNKKKFVFVLENHEEGVIGISGIKAKTGVERAFYSFSYYQNTPYPYLELEKQFLGPSEIGSLFLSPKFRNKKVGRLLSLSRFLFIHSFDEFFTRTIIAELRGYLFKNNVSPIWNAIGKKFIRTSFHNADINASKDIDFIEKKFPKKPIYLNLLPKNSIKYFQQVHPFTEPAKNLLLKEGFKVMNQVDIFDGGPTLECSVKNIRTIKQARRIKVSNLEKKVKNKNYLICNHSLKQFTVMKINKNTRINEIKKKLSVTNNDLITIVEEAS